MHSSTLLTFAAALSLTMTTHARLGETEAQSQVRYGAPEDATETGRQDPLLPGAKELVYHTGEWQIRAAFVNGVAVRMEYMKGKDAQGGRRPSEDELKAILDAEKGKYVWHEKRGMAGRKGIIAVKVVTEWERSDRAKAQIKGPRILIESREAESLAEKLAKQANTKNPATPKPAQAGQPKF